VKWCTQDALRSGSERPWIEDGGKRMESSKVLEITKYQLLNK
jgi:hypothetical protein